MESFECISIFNSLYCLYLFLKCAMHIKKSVILMKCVKHIKKSVHIVVFSDSVSRKHTPYVDI